MIEIINIATSKEERTKTVEKIGCASRCDFSCR
jgi:hypothetical protein